MTKPRVWAGRKGLGPNSYKFPQRCSHRTTACTELRVSLKMIKNHWLIMYNVTVFIVYLF